MEEQEFEALVEQHYQSIYSYCFRHVGERELAQDLTQTAFLNFWRNRARYRRQGKALNYLYTIAGNLYRERYMACLKGLTRPEADQRIPWARQSFWTCRTRRSGAIPAA